MKSYWDSSALVAIAQSDELRDRLAELRRHVAVRVTLLAEDGRVLADSDEDAAQMENHADRPEVRC